MQTMAQFFSAYFVETNLNYALKLKRIIETSLQVLEVHRIEFFVNQEVLSYKITVFDMQKS